MTTRAQLAHAIRTACQLSLKDSVIIIGSQSILGTYSEDELPPEATESREIDVLPMGADATETVRLADEIEGVAGELSPFDQLHRFHLDGVDETTATLPKGWRDRLVPVQNRGTVNIVTGERYLGLCLEPHDLCVAKLCALRAKDRRFVAALLDAAWSTPR
ncbi:MAG TPA: hypothetical protein PKY27_10655 [Arachnia sp.]|jgi:hypothetical protein|nr:hypothetical protein [Arachnia sp.]